jgi:hypothetical protein
MPGGVRQRIYLGIGAHTVVTTASNSMITKNYNPSELEIRFSKALAECGAEIARKMEPLRLEAVETDDRQDNPALHFRFSDADGDHHEIVCRVIQRPDSLS